ncbi:MAG: PhnD/SsuA/transferrin family substrate-binding protein, partial [Sutterellaceae bacterium]|nr:PhnD/SsuA/transferrin family substrate-binding protein [Sutterellaceae bacterium]
FTRYEMNDGMKSLSSLWPLEAPDPAFAVGSLFISRADNEAVTKVTDFVGKKIGAYYPQSYSGYLIGLRDIYQKGVVIQSLRNRITFFGDDPKRIVKAVENGAIDVGILPACRFERMVNAGEIDRVTFRLIETRSSGLIHCAHSTELYPSFYFASMKDVDSGLQKNVSAALYTMTAMADGADWGMPVSNRAVHDLFFDLKIGPYANLAAWQFATFAKEQTSTVMIFLGVSFLIIFYAGSLSVLVRRRTKLLKEALADRERIEKMAAASRDHIANLERTGIVGQMSTMIAHELKQPLGAITNFANGLLRRSKRGAIDPAMMTQVLEEIVEQGTRASEIVNRVRAYAKHQTPELKMADMSKAVEGAIETFKRSRRTEANIVTNIMPYLWADIDEWEIELAVLNLLKNAADATENTELAEIYVSVKPEDRFWRIEVKDNGPKITQEQVDKFMMPLVTSKEGGLGLGISIVGNIAERHHGRLTATANADCGVTMAMDIPRSVMPEHTAI